MDKLSGVLQRSRVIVDEVVRQLPRGASVAGCAKAVGLPRSSVHRLIGELSDVGVLAKREGRWVLGPAALMFASNAPMTVPDIAGLRSAADRLARYSTFSVYVTVMLMGRCFYLLRADGDTPIRIFSVEVGESRRFGESYASVATLSALPESRREAAIAEIVAVRPPFLDIGAREHAAEMRRMLADLDERGWCDGVGMVDGVAGMACVVPGTCPTVAVTISGVDKLLNAAERTRLAPAMLRCAAEMSEIASG